MSNGLVLFLQQIINGLKVGAYTLAFMVPILAGAGLPVWLAVVPAIFICAAVGVTSEQLAYKPVRKKGTKMSSLITAIAMSLFLENLAQVLFGSTPKRVNTIFSLPNVTLGSVTINGNSILTIAIGVAVMVALQLFVKKTKMGRAMRAVSEDWEASTLMGINVNRVITITFAIGSGLAAIASLMYCATYPQATTTMGSMLGLKAFVAAVLGGIGIIPGAMLGGIIIGLVESLSKAYSAALTGGLITSAYSDAVVFLILIIVLLVKPSGILGKNVGEKV